MLAFADVGVSVRDAKAAADWWRESLGFDVHTIGPPGSHAVLVAPPGDRFVLHLCEGFSEVEPGNTGIAFMTDDAATVVARMVEKGVHFVEPFHTEEGQAAGKFSDPDGNIFWLLGAPSRFLREETRRRAQGPESPRRPSRKRRVGRPLRSRRP